MVASSVFSSCEGAAAFLFSKIQKPEIRLATPLGLGKPNDLLNLIYRRVAADPSRKLSIHTALSLGVPNPKEDLAQRFFGPFSERHWGKDYPTLEYARDAIAGKLPKNVRVHEFYFQAASALHSPGLQRDYQSVNYTHVAQSVFDAGIDVIVQLIAREEDSATGEPRYSLSCNPDLTLDVAELYKRAERPLLMIGVVHPDLPFLEGEAQVPHSFFSAIVEDPSVRHKLFALPRPPIDEIDHVIGFRASQLIRDGGTLQIGIGSLSDALVAALLVRQQDPETYRRWVEEFGDRKFAHTEPFRIGLYGLSEMVMDGFMHLRRAGILSREVADEASGMCTYLHGAFFLGSKDFYAWLRSLRGEERRGLRMTPVSRVNDLYDPKELLLRKQRKHPRFVNTCMQATLLGGAASETLEDGRVVSGVGGQYNFVAMAHELPDARSLLLLRSVRESGGRRSSNIVWGHQQLTIPRHLRDIVITEYGVADLQGKTDEECIQAMIGIADSRFQSELLETAKKNGKIAKDYRIPSEQKNNVPERIRATIARERKKGRFAAFPFGSDFTPEEERLALALGKIQAAKDRSRFAIPRMILSGGGSAKDLLPELERMGIPPKGGTLRDRVYRRILVSTMR